MKYFAKQIPVEFTTSPFEYIAGEYWDNDYIITGNKDFIEFTTAHWDTMKKYIPDIETDIFNTAENELTNDRIVEIVKYYFTEINTSAALSIGKYIISCADKNVYEPDYYTRLYSIITGREYTNCTIRGSVQGEWNIIYCPADFTREHIRNIETEYFNTGMEYIVHDSNTPPEGPDDITGYSVYIHAWTDEGIRAELADCIGCKPEELIIYDVSGERKFYTYTKKGE